MYTKSWQLPAWLAGTANCTADRCDRHTWHTGSFTGTCHAQQVKNAVLPEQTSHPLNRFSSITLLKSLSNALLNNAGCCVKDHWTHLGIRPLPDSEAAKAGKAWAGKPDGLLCVARLSKCPMSKSRLICSRSERRAGVSSLACEAVSSSSGEPARKP